MNVDLGDIKVRNRLLMYKSYVQLLKPVLGSNLGIRSIDAIAAILFYTNQIKWRV